MATATNTTLGEIKLAGDLAGSNNGLAPELTATGVTPGSYTLPSVTIDAKGRITAATSTNLSTALPTATSSQLGVARPDNSTIQIDGTGKLSANISIASYGVAGICRPDSTTITIDGAGVISARQATSTLNGIARPDNSTITVDGSGVISAPAIKATSSTLGAVKPDNSTITVDANGTITAAVAAVGIATTTVAGKVKPDNTTVAVAGDGTISLTTPVVPAGTTTLGAVKIGSNINVAGDGTISVNTATSSVLGLVRPDNSTITVSSGVLSAVSVPTATSSVLGLVRPDNSTITVSSGVLSANFPAATASVYGLVKIGSNINVAGDGTISVNTADAASLGVAQVDGTTISSSAGVLSLNAAVAQINTPNTFYAVQSTVPHGAGGNITPGSTTNLTGLESNVYFYSIIASGATTTFTMTTPLPAPVGTKYTFVMRAPNNITSTQFNIFGYTMDVASSGYYLIEFMVLSNTRIDKISNHIYFPV